MSLDKNEALFSLCNPLIQFGRFESGRLQLFRAHMKEQEYFAISHVWGTTQWLKVSCMDHEILASPQKAHFIEEKLPALVGHTAFWMDTLTVNQRDQAEVIRTVQSIPDIFRDAAKTIAIREDDGLYDCCDAATRGFQDYIEFGERLNKHIMTHYGHVYEESYLQRLWTLQECLLSHTIQFVTIKQGKLISFSKGIIVTHEQAMQ